MVYYRDLVIVVVVIQAPAFLQWDTVSPFEDKSRFAKATADTGAAAVGGGFHAGGDTSWATFDVFRIWRALNCTGRGTAALGE